MQEMLDTRRHKRLQDPGMQVEGVGRKQESNTCQSFAMLRHASALLQRSPIKAHQ